MLICSSHCSSAPGSSLDASTLLLQIYSTFRSISRLSSRLATKNFHPKPFMLSSWPAVSSLNAQVFFRFAQPSNLYHRLELESANYHSTSIKRRNTTLNIPFHSLILVNLSGFQICNAFKASLMHRPPSPSMKHPCKSWHSKNLQ